MIRIISGLVKVPLNDDAHARLFMSSMNKSHYVCVCVCVCVVVGGQKASSC